MGSPYFYLEFLLAWLHLLCDAGFTNPALFALQYTLVPAAAFPTQLHQVRAGYDWLLAHLAQIPSSSSSSSASRPSARDADHDDNLEPAARVVLAGDSAGATLQLSLLHQLHQSSRVGSPTEHTRRPVLATLISPWCALVSPHNRDTASDYLCAESLHLYARQYAGAAPERSGETLERSSDGDTNGGGADDNNINADAESQAVQRALQDPLASPAACTDAALWKALAPRRGWHFVFGAEEVLGPEVRRLLTLLRRGDGGGDADRPVKDRDGARRRRGGSSGEGKGGGGVRERERVRVREEPGAVHAWPVVSLFLGATREERLSGLEELVAGVVEAVGVR